MWLWNEPEMSHRCWVGMRQFTINWALSSVSGRSIAFLIISILWWCCWLVTHQHLLYNKARILPNYGIGPLLGCWRPPVASGGPVLGRRSMLSQLIRMLVRTEICGYSDWLIGLSLKNRSESCGFYQNNLDSWPSHDVMNLQYLIYLHGISLHSSSVWENLTKVVSLCSVSQAIMWNYNFM